MFSTEVIAYTCGRDTGAAPSVPAPSHAMSRHTPKQAVNESCGDPTHAKALLLVALHPAEGVHRERMLQMVYIVNAPMESIICSIPFGVPEPANHTL